MSTLDIIASLWWRVGTHNERMLYAINSKDDEDIRFGMTFDPAVATYIVEVHNAALAKSASDEQ